ncbi:MAG: bifunctional UDP-sugar hydrolase/5'-nucleotidase [Desulfobacterales bacterium]|nr:bifunctional UDP-sugar hydrolase/5'-nucleotidase [Desulfobacterales bacterium]MDX2508637.1 bifunctional UDP-sugar hydrolase/5'-nucleotidase [Desulfobacterales bacterium]
MKRLLAFLVPFLLIMISQQIIAAEKTITIVHSNDLHSHFLGAPPNIAYTPFITGDDETIGGLARIATVIKTVKQNRKNPVLVLDAGDFMMGSLFHMLSREHSFELRLLSMMGYDAVTLGNHEFDLKPDGLARILRTAHRYGQIPPLVLSNAVFSQESSKDDSLEKIFTRGFVKPYIILEKAGLRIGIFGLLGKNAAEVAPFASPVTFDDPITSAQRMVKILRETEKADMVICLSHSGLSENKKRSEDETLARDVNGIDIIISGHTHTKIKKALLVNDTIIVQAWAYGKQLGVIDIAYNDGRVFLKNYKLVDIDDKIKGDTQISRQIEAFKADINRQVLAEEGLTFRKILAETDFDLFLKTEESNLGNLIADSIRWYINKNNYNPADPSTKVVASIISNGVIRDPIVKGKTGQIAVCDVFRAIPLGIGFDDAETMGYPLITIYVYPAELKKALEVLTSVYPLKGSDYFLQVSGIQFTYNPYRMIFDRVSEIRIGDEENGYQLLDYSESNRNLLRIGADIYNSTFLKVIGNFTWNVLDIVPKDRNGNPIDDLKTMRLDSDKQKSGIQELKEWKAVMEYIKSFPDTDGDGLPDIPEKYRKKLGRNVIEASLNPYKLLKRGTYVTWLAFSALLLVILLILTAGWFIIKKIRS